MKIFVVRHGETDLNKMGVLQGQRQDTELNELGISQAQATAQVLPAGVITICFSSPLKRSSKTAEIIANKLNIPIVFRDELKEKDYGDLSGKHFEEAKQITGVDRTTMRTKLDLTPYGGESVEEFKNRITHFVEDLRRNFITEVPLVVTHAGVMRMMHLILKGQEITEIANASIHEFEI